MIYQSFRGCKRLRKGPLYIGTEEVNCINLHDLSDILVPSLSLSVVLTISDNICHNDQKLACLYVLFSVVVLVVWVAHGSECRWWRTLVLSSCNSLYKIKFTSTIDFDASSNYIHVGDVTTMIACQFLLLTNFPLKCGHNFSVEIFIFFVSICFFFLIY